MSGVNFEPSGNIPEGQGKAEFVTFEELYQGPSTEQLPRKIKSYQKVVAKAKGALPQRAHDLSLKKFDRLHLASHVLEQIKKERL